MWKRLNLNPYGRNVGDCTVRAISKALGQTWRETYMGLCAEGLKLCDMPSSNVVWNTYVRENGWNRHTLPDFCPDCYTVKDFCSDHRNGTYILATHNHVICIKNGDYYDSWDSGYETPLYYWSKGA